MTDPKRIVPPAPRTEANPRRTVDIPPTVKDVDNSQPRPPKNKVRVDFRVEDFRRVLDQHGKYCVWEKAILCPCLNETTGQTLVNCTNCDGNGYVYVDPIDIRAHMAMFDKGTKIYEKFGMWIEGTTAITVEPQYRLHFRDRITMRDSLMPFNELIKKANRRGIRSKLPDGVDSARYRIVSITKAMYAPQSPDGPLVALEPGFHFDIDDNGWLRWLPNGNSAVPDGTYVSILYDFHPSYQIISHPHVLRDDVQGRKSTTDTVVGLPIQAAAKLDYLLDVNVAVSQ